MRTIYPNGKATTIEVDMSPIRVNYHGVAQTFLLFVGTPQQRRTEVDNKMKRLLLTNDHFTSLRMLFLQKCGELLMSSNSAFEFFNNHFEFQNGKGFNEQTLSDLLHLATIAPHHGQTVDQMIARLTALPLGAPALMFELYFAGDGEVDKPEERRWFRVEAVCMTDPVISELAVSIKLIEITDLKTVQYQLSQKEKELRQANKLIRRQVCAVCRTVRLSIIPTKWFVVVLCRRAKRCIVFDSKVTAMSLKERVANCRR